MVQRNSEGKKRFGLDTDSSNITCSADDVQVQVQLELITGGTAVLVSHRECVRKDLNNREGSTTTGDQNFAIQSNVSYCLYDLCNAEMTSENAPKTPAGGKAPETSSSLECYSGLNFDRTEPFLEKVRCSKGYNQCYQGEGMITAGLLTIPMYIRTCQRPSCAVPQSQSFGPIMITSEGGSCCTGSYCNAKEVESQAQKSNYSVPANGSHGEGAVNHTTNFTEPHVEDGISSTSPVPGTGSVTPGHSWETSPPTATLDSNYDYDETEDSDGNDENVDPESSNPRLIPRTRGSGPKGPTLQCCPLLVVLGITVFGVWW
ncbi:ly6/PLAUR domain-containing protein 3-like [Elgaria multicarinata webbii]|uniref:ly6/PLAUR domain-containing protein 3-like n=1 Tax=Elgaria multicarinata webbii TaxID=159646 RepID=UPI002FCCFE72